MKTRLRIVVDDLEFPDNDFTGYLLDSEAESWELEQHCYGQPDVLSFRLRISPHEHSAADVLRLIASKEVALELIDPQGGGYLNGEWSLRKIDTLFGGTIIEVSVRRHGAYVDYHIKALGWIHLLENILVSENYQGDLTETDALLGRARDAANNIALVEGIFDKLEASDNSFDVERELRANIKLRVTDTDGSPRNVDIRSWVPAQAPISIKAYNHDVHLRLDRDSVKDALDKLSSMSDAEWRIDADKVLWYLAPEADSLTSEWNLGDGTDAAVGTNIATYRMSFTNAHNEYYGHLDLYNQPDDNSAQYYGTDLAHSQGEVGATRVDVPRPLVHTDGALFQGLRVAYVGDDHHYAREVPSGYVLELLCSQPLMSNKHDWQGYVFRLYDGGVDSGHRHNYTLTTDRLLAELECELHVIGLYQETLTLESGVTQTRYVLSLEIGRQLYDDFKATEYHVHSRTRYRALVIDRERARFSDFNQTIDLSKLKNHVKLYGGSNLGVYTEPYAPRAMTAQVDINNNHEGWFFSLAREYGAHNADQLPDVYLAPTRAGGYTEDLLKSEHAADPTRVLKLVVSSSSDPDSTEGTVVYTADGPVGSSMLYQVTPTPTKTIWVVGPDVAQITYEDTDAQSIADYGQRTVMLVDTSINDEPAAVRRVKAELKRFTTQIEKVSVTTTRDGFIAGTVTKLVSKFYDIVDTERWYIETVTVSGLYGHLRTYELTLRRILERVDPIDEIAQLPPAKVTGVRTSPNVSRRHVRVDWNSATRATGYQLQYSIGGSPGWRDVVAYTTDTHATHSNNSVGSIVLEYRVRGLIREMDGTYSALGPWSDVVFTGGRQLATPTQLVWADYGTNPSEYATLTGRVSWRALPAIDNVEIYYEVSYTHQNSQEPGHPHHYDYTVDTPYFDFDEVLYRRDMAPGGGHHISVRALSDSPEYYRRSEWSSALLMTPARNTGPTVEISPTTHTATTDNEVVTLVATVSDDRDSADQLTYAWSTIPEGGDFNGTEDERIARWTAPARTQGQAVYRVTVRVTDTAGLHNVDTATVTVAGTNRGPTVTLTSDAPDEDHVRPGSVVTLTARAADPDNDSLAWDSWDHVPEIGIGTFTPTNEDGGLVQTATWVPAYALLGYDVTFEQGVEDPYGQAQFDQLTLHADSYFEPPYQHETVFALRIAITSAIQGVWWSTSTYTGLDSARVLGSRDFTYEDQGTTKTAMLYEVRWNWVTRTIGFYAHGTDTSIRRWARNEVQNRGTIHLQKSDGTTSQINLEETTYDVDERGQDRMRFIVPDDHSFEVMAQSIGAGDTFVVAFTLGPDRSTGSGSLQVGGGGYFDAGTRTRSAAGVYTTQVTRAFDAPSTVHARRSSVYVDTDVDETDQIEVCVDARFEVVALEYWGTDNAWHALAVGPRLAPRMLDDTVVAKYLSGAVGAVGAAPSVRVTYRRYIDHRLRFRNESTQLWTEHTDRLGAHVPQTAEVSLAAGVDWTAELSLDAAYRVTSVDALVGSEWRALTLARRTDAGRSIVHTSVLPANTTQLRWWFDANV